mgnify:FL=1
MKKFSLIALMLIVGCISLNAQTTSTPKAVVAATTPQILYRGVDNPISIAVDGISDEFITAEISNASAKIKKVGKSSYIVNIEDKIREIVIIVDSVDTDGVEFQMAKKVQIPNNSIGIDVYAQIGTQKKNAKVLLSTTYFIAKDFVQPSVKVVKNDGGLIDKKDLLKNPFISIEVEDFDFPVEYNISYFQMTFSSKGSKNAEPPYVSKSKNFTPEMISRIKNLKKGDKIYIEGISAYNQDGPVKLANPVMIFTIK